MREASGVRRCFSEKKKGYDVEARSLLGECRRHLAIDRLTGVRIFHRYDVEGLSDEAYLAARRTVFSEAVCDDLYDEELPPLEGRFLAVEPLPGQFDQRADSLAQCVALLTGGERPLTASAAVYLFEGPVGDEDMEKIERHLVNPVEARRAALGKPATLRADYPSPGLPPVLEGFRSLDGAGLSRVGEEYALAMDGGDLAFLQRYFKEDEGRDPTLTELRVLDTYWSDHCRHTTFSTLLEGEEIADEAVSEAFDEYLALRREVYGEKAESRPVTLMDMATIAMKALKKRGLLPGLDESEEINACTVKVEAEVDGKKEDWLLLFKNETHNHPTEIEPFGGAATCLGGAIRDPLSGRAYVYQAMRVTGAADPRRPESETPPGKLSQRRITTTAAAGYSSYGNQIGLATGFVDEYYHPGYVAKRMEIGAVVGAAPAKNVVRERPEAGDLVVLLGGRTGRDGCGGATGSSKSHSEESLASCGAEVQKGNPPEERKLQRLFRNPAATRLIKRCNDFGAGGVSVAVGELADGLSIDLDALPKKYEGLDGTELAISESQERMAVVVRASDAERLMELAGEENLEATVIARVTAEPRLVMRFRGRKIVNLARSFLDTNGAPKRASFSVPKRDIPDRLGELCCGGPTAWLEKRAADLAFCSRRGLVERFDGSIGASSVLMPFGGKNQLTPAQVMAAKLPASGETDAVSVMACGFDPFLSEANAFAGAASAVTESLARLVSAGCAVENCYLTLQEYFERLRNEPERWGKPVSALLGAMKAQMGYSVAAIGGKDSMSGSFGGLDVPPTLVSFAVATARAGEIITPEFKGAGHGLYVFSAPFSADGLPLFDEIKAMWRSFGLLAASGRVKAAYALGKGGVADAAMKMAFGNDVGAAFDQSVDVFSLFAEGYGSILAEVEGEAEGAVRVGGTTDEPFIVFPDGRRCELENLKARWQRPLEEVFPTRADAEGDAPLLSYAGRALSVPAIKSKKPRAVIPVFPGTNCEYDTARALERAGGEGEILVIRNGGERALAESAAALRKAISRAQMIVLPGGFSGGDEPEGSGKFIAAFFRNPAITEEVRRLLFERDGLMLGICNGFQALVKLGLVPFGDVRDLDESCPTLTFNRIGRHQSRYVTTRVASVKSPWLSRMEVGELHAVPVSHGEGRFVAPPALLSSLAGGGQIAFQYADGEGKPSLDIAHNPNGSAWAVEGITSPCGRILGKMAHSERSGPFVANNIVGNKLQPLFEGGVDYFA